MEEKRNLLEVHTQSIHDTSHTTRKTIFVLEMSVPSFCSKVGLLLAPITKFHKAFGDTYCIACKVIETSEVILRTKLVNYSILFFSKTKSLKN